MKMAQPSILVVTDIDKCKDIVRHLEKCDVISVNAEGVQLGKDGPLTLLQIGTLDNKVYLFDVKETPGLFTSGNLKSILTENKIVKVIHSCSKDSAALYYQFNVHLQNVFDTQLAHLVITEHKGVVLPPRLKLEDICNTYSKTAKVSDQKENVKKTCLKRNGDYWNQRPLTDEMIDCAAGDVTALIPDVYETQKNYIEQNGLWAEYAQRVNEEINYQIDDKIRAQNHARVHRRVLEVIDKIPQKYTLTTKLDDIDDEDDLRALQRVKFAEAEKMDPVISYLKTKSIEADLDEFTKQLDEEGKDFIPRWRSDSFLRSLNSHTSKDIQERSRLVRNRINNVLIEDISRKYSFGTPTNLITRNEKDALRSIGPRSVNDSRFHKTVLKLYWLIQEEELDERENLLLTEGRTYTITKVYYNKIKWFSSGRDLPRTLNEKALQHIQSIDKIFGLGEIPIPT